MPDWIRPSSSSESSVATTSPASLAWPGLTWFTCKIMTKVLPGVYTRPGESGSTPCTGLERKVVEYRLHRAGLVQRVEMNSGYAKTQKSLALFGGIFDTEIELRGRVVFHFRQQPVEPRWDLRPAHRCKAARLGRGLNRQQAGNNRHFDADLPAVINV